MPRTLTLAERQLREMTEREWQSRVCDLAQLCGWRWVHFRPARLEHGHWRTAFSGHPGFPDLVLVRGAQGIAAELKREVGPGPTPEQLAWLQAFGASGFEVYCWRPHDWPVVQQVLSGRRAAGQLALGRVEAARHHEA